MTKFKDVEFMTAREKQLVLKNWKLFLKKGMLKEHFTKRLYQHLSLHCGFIAHYNIHGFYGEYFESVESKKQFFDHLFDGWNMDIMSDDYKDLITEMKRVWEEGRQI